MVRFTNGLANISYNVRDEWKVAFQSIKGPLHPLICLQNNSSITLLLDENEI